MSFLDQFKIFDDQLVVNLLSVIYILFPGCALLWAYFPNYFQDLDVFKLLLITCLVGVMSTTPFFIPLNNIYRKLDDYRYSNRFASAMLFISSASSATIGGFITWFCWKNSVIFKDYLTIYITLLSTILILLNYVGTYIFKRKIQ